MSFSYSKESPPSLSSKIVREYWPEIFSVVQDIEFGTCNSIGLLTLFDLIAHYLDVRNEWVAAGGSSVSEDDKGRLSRSPELSGFIQLQGQLTNMLKEYGLTPLSAARLASIQKGGGEGKDDLDSFFKGASA